MFHVAGTARLGVDVWCAHVDLTDASVAGALPILSPDELARAGRALADPVRRRYVCSRAAVRRILAAHLGCAPETLAFERGEHGKPYLRAGPHFSWTTSGDVTLCAVSPDREVGVDVERIRPAPDAAALALRCCSPEDALAVARAPGIDEATRIFLAAWTRREAHAKATGEGLRDGPEAWRIDPLRWTAQELAGPGWVGALVVARGPATG